MTENLKMTIPSIWLKMAFLFDPIQVFFNGNFWQIFEKKFAKFANGKAVIDLACGTGELKKYIKCEEYLGIDLNHAYISFAKHKFQNVKVNFLTGDITKFTIPKNFDTAFLVSVAHHLSSHNLDLVCRQIKRSRIETVIIVDGYPYNLFSGILSWLDRVLGGGKYLRNERDLAKTLSKNLKVERIGSFKAERSFYYYPYVILTNK